MIYIVTGLMRTGTSLMMQILREGGVRPYYSRALERRAKAGRLRNPHFYEAKPCLNGDITGVPDGHSVKVFLHGLVHVDFSAGQYKVLVMRRSTEARMKSTRHRLPTPKWQNYQKKCLHANTGIERLYDELPDMCPDYLLVDYDDLIDCPHEQLERVAEYTGLPDILKAGRIIRPDLRHFEEKT